VISSPDLYERQHMIVFRIWLVNFWQVVDVRVIFCLAPIIQETDHYIAPKTKWMQALYYTSTLLGFIAVLLYPLAHHTYHTIS